MKRFRRYCWNGLLPPRNHCISPVCPEPVQWTYGKNDGTSEELLGQSSNEGGISKFEDVTCRNLQLQLQETHNRTSLILFVTKMSSSLSFPVAALTLGYEHAKGIGWVAHNFNKAREWIMNRRGASENPFLSSHVSSSSMHPMAYHGIASMCHMQLLRSCMTNLNRYNKW